MKKILTIVRKEWAEVFKNRMVIFTISFLPILMTAIPLIMVYSLQSSALVSEFMMLFMFIPVAIPVTISAYSIVGEKTTHSLEPLLATPITTLELLVGKCLAALIPAILATYLAYAIFSIGSYLILSSPAIFSVLLDLRWLIAILIVGPLLALMAVVFSLMVSSRVNDPRVAEQISMVIILPVLVAFFGQVTGFFILNRTIISIIAVAMLAIDLFMLMIATRIFQREQILTKWK